MIYTFFSDTAMHKRSTSVISQQEKNQGCGFISDKMKEFFAAIVSIEDSRDSRLTILDKKAKGISQLYFDLKQVEDNLFEKVTVTELNKLFNICELCYLTQNATVKELEEILIKDDAKYGIYRPKSLTLSDYKTNLNLYVEDKTTEKVDINHQLGFKVLLNEKDIEFTVWLSSDDFVADYPISTICDIVYPVSPKQLITLDYKSLLEAVEKSAKYMEEKINNNKLVGDYSNLYIFETTYRHDKYPTTRIPIGILYKGKTPSINDCKSNVRMDLIAQDIAPLEVLKRMFPELFAEDRFYIIPMWDQKQIVAPEKTLDQAIVNHSLMNFVMHVIFHWIDSEKLTKQIEVFRAACSQMTLLTVPGRDNNEEVLSLKGLHPTYQAVDAKDENFKYESPETQQFNIDLNKCIAKMNGAYNDLPITEDIVDGRHYVVFISGSAEYYVLESRDYPIDKPT